MIVPGQMVEVKWSNVNKNHYLNKGYTYTKNNQAFSVDVKDVSKGSRALVKCQCDNCENIFTREAKLALIRNKHFCNEKCKSNYQKINPTSPSMKIKVECTHCEQSFTVANYRYLQYKNGETKNIFCSKKCKNEWSSINLVGENNPNYTSIIKNCENCNKEYRAPLHREKTTRYCSEDCKRIGSRKTIKKFCYICNKVVITTPSKLKKSKSGKVFCSNSCVGKYNSIKHKENRINKTCVICKKLYDVKPSESERSVTCSHKCQSKWQSLYLTGEKANNFNKNFTLEQRFHNCDWCGKSYKLKNLDKIANKGTEDNPYFCSKDCYRDWYAKDWSQRKEWKEESRIRTVKMISDGKFPKLNNSLQKRVEKLLDKMKIEYIPEFNCKYHAIDLYIPAFNLFIELNGRFWHCDPRVYNEINYKQQFTRIIQDKRKHSYILNKYESNILYLWEDDINNNIELIEKLIRISSKQELNDYQSFNYFLSKNRIQLNKNIIKPYIDYSISELNNLFRPKDDNQILSKKQTDKWIVFRCENCGKGAEQLKSRYMKSKHHYCSRECYYNHSLI